MASRQHIETASSSTLGLKSIEYRDPCKHDTVKLRIQAAIVKEAAKIMQKEHAKIEKKKTKTHSKQLPSCIEKYSTSLEDLKSALKEMTEIVTDGGFAETKPKHIQVGLTRSLTAPKGKRSRTPLKEETFRGISTECMFCFKKDARIQELEKQLTRQAKENEESLGKILQSKDDLQQRFESEILKLKDMLNGRYEVQSLKQKCEKYERMYKEEMAAKEDALCRLSAVASSKLRDNNPNITDLSDHNRPTKIAEKMNELYDNQWTEAFEILEKQCYGTDEEIIQKLRNTFQDVYGECSRLAKENFFERVQRTIELPVQANVPDYFKDVMPDQLKQQIKEFRKSRAPAVVEEMKTVVKRRIQSKDKYTEEFQAYLSRCIEIGWLCAVQDPPLVLRYQAPHIFDTNAFREYTVRGKYTKFVVWPALYLSKGGALLTKGVAQGTDKEPSTDNATASARKTRGRTMPTSSSEPLQNQHNATATPLRGKQMGNVQSRTQQWSQSHGLNENECQSTDL